MIFLGAVILAFLGLACLAHLADSAEPVADDHKVPDRITWIAIVGQRIEPLVKKKALRLPYRRDERGRFRRIRRH